jgi:hypothetical protein
MHINNVQFSLLEASEDFMATLLLLPSGIITDRVGGAGESKLNPFFVLLEVGETNLQYRGG